jgi:regulator of sigma E protease
MIHGRVRQPDNTRTTPYKKIQRNEYDVLGGGNMPFEWTPLGIVLTVVLFVVLVAIHEWGHFAFARRAGVWVKEFAIGFGPKIVSFTRGETKYTFRLLPFGGFVRMAGEDGDADDAPLERQYMTKSVWQRAQIIFAGPLMNIVLAMLLFIVFAYGNGVPEHIAIKETLANEPAQLAGLRSGDVIVQIDGTEIGTQVERISERIGQSANRTTNWVVRREGKLVTVSVTPKSRIENGQTVIRVGIRMEAITRTATVTEGISNGMKAFGDAAVLIFDGFKRLVLGQFEWDDLGGPIRIAEMTVQIASASWIQYAWWAAMLNLYLACFNLLPIPALDGSRLIFLAVEAVRRKPVQPRWENVIHFIGFSLLMMMMLIVTYHDIIRLFRG